jgi:AraC family transcriptional activator of pobA
MPRRPADPIPVHHMEPADSDGIRIEFFEGEFGDQDDMELLGAHRDEYYIFFLLQKGRLHMNIDFTPTTMRGLCAGYLLPGQVHNYLDATSIQGWMLAIDAERIDAELRERFDSRIVRDQVIRLKGAEAAIGCLRLAKELPPLGTQLQQSVRRNLVNAAIGYLAISFEAKAPIKSDPGRRTAIITGDFLQLVKSETLTLRSPAAFAQRLSISTAYLNEAVKSETGFPASYWIQHEMALEAKRLLYHTDLSVKEIAALLGFDDAAYFSRFFRRHADLTPVEFRTRYRESS